MNISIQKPAACTPIQAYRWFVNDISEWWPKAYSWSGQQLVNMRIDAIPNGLCTETGPYLFRCDWGRVLEEEEGKMIRLSWQIGPGRVPEPNPDKASEVWIRFTEHEDEGCLVDLRHIHFERHGDGYQAYYEGMASAQGWDFILNCFIAYCDDQRQSQRPAKRTIRKKTGAKPITGA